MKILYVTTIGLTMIFFKSFVKELIDNGNIVEIATNESDIPVPECYREWGCKVHQISCSRSPLNKSSLTAIKEIKTLVESNKYDIVHCHTPVAAMCTRLACRKARKSGTKVFYTAHGFHFYKGAPFFKWLMYYPVEKICSYFTDTLITINKEDYNLAKNKMHAKSIEYVPGVGVDLQKFESKFKVVSQKRDRVSKCEDLGISSDKVWLLNIGELIPRKNQETLIRAVADMNEVTLTIAGEGILHDNLMRLIEELNISDRVKLIGYRTDISELCKHCDIFVFSSIHEGLPVSLMEAMASGLPCAVSKIRGNTDLIDENGGVLFDPHSVDECKKVLKSLLNSDLIKMGEYNREKIKAFSVEKVNKIMLKIYESEIELL